MLAMGFKTAMEIRKRTDKIETTMTSSIRVNPFLRVIYNSI